MPIGGSIRVLINTVLSEGAADLERGLQKLEKLKDIRPRVDGLDIAAPEAIDHYTTMNAQLLAVVTGINVSTGSA